MLILSLVGLVKAKTFADLPRICGRNVWYVFLSLKRGVKSIYLCWIYVDFEFGRPF